MNSPKVVVIGAGSYFFARPVIGMTQLILDTHELTAQAAATYDRDVLLRALCTDPIVNNLEDAKAVMADLLEAQRDVLRPQWYR